MENGQHRIIPPPVITRAGRVVEVSLLGFEKLEFTYHALKQMKIRGITQNNVIEAIRSPTRTGLPTQPGRTRVRKNRGNASAIDVVYEELDDRLLVITAIRITRS